MTQAQRPKTFSGRGALPVAACEGLPVGPDQKTGGTGKPAPRGPYVTQSLRASGSFYSVSPGGSSSPVLAECGAGVGRPSRHAEIPAGAPGCLEGDSLHLRAGESLPAFLGGIDPVVFRKRDAKAFYEGCAAAGLTKAETAKLGGISLASVMQYSYRHDLQFVISATRDLGLDDAVVTLHRDGLSRAAVAARLGITDNQVRRIAHRLNLRWRDRREVLAKADPAEREFQKIQNLGLRTRMEQAKAQLTAKQLEDFEYLIASWEYRFVPALRGVGRYDLAAFVEGK